MRKAVQGILGAVLLAALPRTGTGADIVIEKEGAGKTSIDVSRVRQGAEAPEFRKTLANDLERSGWFKATSVGQAPIVVAGELKGSAAGLLLQCTVRNVASGRDYINRLFVEENGSVRDLAHEVADEIVRIVKGVPGIAATRVVMIGALGRGRDVFICDADGMNLVRITSSGAICLAPDWSPDGTSVIYTSFHGGFPDVYAIDVGARQRKRLAGYPGMNTGAAVSPDGRKLALTLSKDGNPELYVLDLKSRELTRLTRTRFAAEASPSWSPDGRRLVYVSDQAGAPHLYVTGLRSGNAVRVTFRGSENVAPDWGPDGRIAYSSRREGNYHICVTDEALREAAQVTTGGADYEDPSWAPDSRHIVCSRTQSYRSGVYIVDTMGDPPLRLSPEQGNWYAPAWSPR